MGRIWDGEEGPIEYCWGPELFSSTSVYTTPGPPDDTLLRRWRFLHMDRLGGTRVDYTEKRTAGAYTGEFQGIVWGSPKLFLLSRTHSSSDPHVSLLNVKVWGEL